MPAESFAVTVTLTAWPATVLGGRLTAYATATDKAAGRMTSERIWRGCSWVPQAAEKPKARRSGARIRPETMEGAWKCRGMVPSTIQWAHVSEAHRHCISRILVWSVNLEIPEEREPRSISILFG